jgi:hypothetical protein
VAQIEVETLPPRRIDLPTIGEQHLGDRLQGAKDDAGRDAPQTTTTHRLDDRGVSSPGLGIQRGVGTGPLP